MGVRAWIFPDPDRSAATAALQRQDRLTKPRGSLGVLERIPVQLASLQRTAIPSSRPAAAILFAADHPVAKRGVSAFPQEVTAAMVANFAHGGAAASVLARAQGISLSVVDVGVAHPYQVAAGAPVDVVREPVAELPVGDIVTEDAMSDDVYDRSLAAGMEAVDRVRDAKVLAIGEMGIGNTTLATAIASALLGRPASEMVGAGTGVVGDQLRNKADVVDRALRRIGLGDGEPTTGARSGHEIVRRVGGREIAAMIGAMARAGELGIAVLVDGFIATAAALALVRTDERARAHLLFAHRSHEQAHGRLLAALDAQPLLDLGMRLGEASGALTAIPLLDLACRLHAEMATFESAHVPDAT